MAKSGSKKVRKSSKGKKDSKGKKKSGQKGGVVDHKQEYQKYKQKYLNLKNKQCGGFWLGGESEEDHSKDLSNWIHKEGVTVDGLIVEKGPVAYYSEMVKKYGKPTYCVNQPQGVCKWIKGMTEKDITPHESIMLKDEFVKHDKPKEHYDFMYSIVKVYVPPEKLVEVLKISGSINYDPLLKHLRARCGSFAANFATFKTAFDVIDGTKTDYGENINSKEEKEQFNEELTKQKVMENQTKYSKELQQDSYPIETI